jgi:hypothetical protein
MALVMKEAMLLQQVYLRMLLFFEKTCLSSVNYSASKIPNFQRLFLISLLNLTVANVSLASYLTFSFMLMKA